LLVLTAKLVIRGSTYGELANLHIIDTKNFLFLASTELEDRKELANTVEGAKDDAGTDKGISTTRKRVSNLVPELNPVMVQPASRDDAVAVKMRNVVT
jgi:hypothetical protein